MNLNKMTKKQLIERICKLESLLDEMPSYDQLSEQYDQGFDEGYYRGKEEAFQYLPNYELSQYSNVIRFDEIAS